MRLVFALAAVVLAALYGTAATAQTPPLYYCDPLRIYNYPGAPNCPTPWRVVSPATGSPQPYAARSAPETAAAPQSARPSFPALGDRLDDWCTKVSLPSSVAICSDRELRSLMIERQNAYDEARSRLPLDQQKALLSDQNGWVKTYPRACGLSQDVPPSLPLAPAIKDCMAQVGRARIVYLKAYGAPSDAATITAIRPAAPTNAPAPQAASPPPPRPAPRTVSAFSLAGDPLLDAVHKELMKRAVDICGMTLKRATEECFNGNQIKPEDDKDCPQNLYRGIQKLCPDGPAKLVADWEAHQRADTITFRDFVLDKEQMAQPDEYGTGKFVFVRGVYIRAPDNMDYLLAPGKINPMAYGESLNPDVAIPLLLDDKKFGGTDRNTRAALLRCREKYPPETFTGCSVRLDGSVQKCQITMFLTGASHEVVCIKESDVVVDPRS